MNPRITLRRGAMAILLAALATSAATGADTRPTLVVRSGLADADAKLWIGQRVVLNLDVLSFDGWANLPSLPTVRVPGAIVYPSGSSAIRLNETIDGKACSGQRYELWIYPRRPGRFTVPAMELAVSEKVFGASGGDRATSATTAPISFSCEAPPGWDPDLPHVTSPAFEASQDWSPDVAEASVGDGITRLFTMTASDVPGMVLPPLSTSPIAAVRPYPKQPRVDDTIDRGSLNSRRADSEVLVFQGEGRFELPGVQIQWWNPQTETLRTISLPGRTIDVAPAAATGPGPDRSSQARTAGQLRRTLVVAGALVLLGLLAWAWVRRTSLLHRWQRRQSERAHSERAFFQSFEKAAAANDAPATLNALLRWLDRIAPPAGGKVTLLADLVRKADDPALRGEIDQLLAAIDQDAPAGWQGAGIRSSLQPVRRSLLRERKPPRSSARALPPLNHSPHPTSTDPC